MLAPDDMPRPPLPTEVQKAISNAMVDVPSWSDPACRHKAFLVQLSDTIDGKPSPSQALETRESSSTSGALSESDVGLHITEGDRWRFLNHGAFGAPCLVGHRVASAWRAWIERQPLRAVDRALFPHLAHAIRRTAASLGVSHRRVALVPNATTGVNAAFRSARLGSKRGVLLLSLGYGANKTMARAYCAEAGAPPPAIADVPLPLDCTAATATNALEDAAERALVTLPPDCACALVVVDLVTSNSGGVWWEGVRAVAAAARRHSSGALVLVDGAHAWGQLSMGKPVANGHSAPSSVASSVASSRASTPPRTGTGPRSSSPSPSPGRRTSGSLRRPRGVPPHSLDQPLASLPFDFFVTNGHKWLCAPRGVAALVVSQRGRDLCVPPVRSHGAEAGFAGAFVWDGCRDYAAALAIPEVLDWWEAQGGGMRGMQARCRALLRRVDGELRRAWFGEQAGAKDGAGAGGDYSPASASHDRAPGPGPQLLPDSLHSHLRLVPLPDGILPPGVEQGRGRGRGQR